MQALFFFTGSALACYASAFVESDGPRPALILAVAVLHLAIATGHRVRRTEGAFYISAGHAGKNLLFDQGISPSAPGYAVSASIILCANNGNASSRLFLPCLAPFLALPELGVGLTAS